MSENQAVAHLYAPVRAILAAPDVDLSSISAKRVRRQLVDDGHADAALVKAQKAALDALIGEVFSEVSSGNTGTAGGDGGESEANGEDGYGEEGTQDGADTDGVDGEDAGEEEEERVVKKERKPAGKKRKAVDDDEAVARALHAQINGGRPSRAAAPPAKKRAKKVKSADTVDGEDAPKKKRGGGGFQKPYQLSEPLAAVVGTDSAPRPTVVKLLWEHIKGHELQNPNDKREIMCDDALRAIFGKDKVTMFSMNKELSAHLSPMAQE
ncbi:unnamed protein product [Peniophora sp. CBMAI 1063]|nr:unnamed protein product [Peniophora sp. CBMAI 1063]